MVEQSATYSTITRYSASSNRLFNLLTEKFVCFENKGQCLVVSLQRTKVT